MRKLVLAALLTVLTYGPSVQACSENGHTGIAEENTMHIGVNDKNANSVIDEATFNSVLDRIEAIFTPDFAARGKQLSVVRKWSDGTVNAYAQQSGNTWKITMFGGLARHVEATADAFAAVACHELGHHIGGAPKKGSIWGSSWASNEGQSDYYATSKCMRKYMESEDNQAVVAQMEIPEVVTTRCEASFANAEEIAMCKRGAMAGEALAKLLNSLRTGSDPVSFTTPDRAVVSSTNHNHPAAQCRLDTYFAGAICDQDASIDPDSTDANTGYCMRVDGYQDGTRPLCWFKPSASL
ncbi:MAG: hypothetical protein CME71_07880 [Halobacteriovorax sp.]|nr:hypothetical protein [Halobacteriovorax sp.]